MRQPAADDTLYPETQFENCGDIHIIYEINSVSLNLELSQGIFITALLGGDYYGSRYSTSNYGITYTVKAFTGLVSGWLGGYLVMPFGSFRPALILWQSAAYWQFLFRCQSS